MSAATRARRHAPALVLEGAAILAVATAVAYGGPWLPLGVVLAVAPLAYGLITRGATPRVRAHVAAVEVPVVLLLVSTLTFRIRDAAGLADNPVDAAGLFRLALQAAALFLALTSLFFGRGLGGRMTSRPMRLYVAYAAIACIGAAVSVFPLLTVYRVMELVTALVVIIAAAHAGGAPALKRVGVVLYWWIVVLLATVWANVLVFPGESIAAADSPIPWQIRSTLPAIASNSVGTIGVLATLWSVARLAGGAALERPGRRATHVIAATGVVTLLAAQYRTGYVALILGLLAILAVRGRRTLVVLMAGLAVVAALWGPAVIAKAQPYALRGDSTEEAARLSGRFTWWSLSIPVWRTSPVAGRGLGTATRFEVLEQNGYGATSTIHGTWIEALVGTGLAGLAALAGAFLVSLRRGYRRAVRSGDLGPLMILATLAVRSATGSTFEAFGLSALLFAWVAASMRDEHEPEPGA